MSRKNKKILQKILTILIKLYIITLVAIEINTFPDSSMVEHSAVNRRVVGSSPIRGAS